MATRFLNAVESLELAAANAMRTSRSPAARRAVREALAELRMARLLEAENATLVHAANEVEKINTPPPPAGHPAALGDLPAAACEAPSKTVQSQEPRGYLGAHLSCPREDDDE